MHKCTNYKLDASTFKAFQILTQYDCRLYEQSIMSVVKPTLNSKQEVIFSFKWDPQVSSTDILGSRPIIAIQKDSDNTYVFDSIRQAAKALDIDTRSIKGVLNIENAYRGSRSSGELFSFIEENKPMRADNRYNQNTPIIEGIDYNGIPNGSV